jgi:ADP-L-glycero-D-manno-heptose 6-epimerase
MRLFRSNDVRIADGEQSRDFVFVDDCVEQLLWMWRHRPANGVYNSGTGGARTFFDLARGVFAALGREPNISFIDMPADIARQYQNFTQAEMHAIRVAGFDRPATMLEDGIARTVATLHRSATAA